MGRANFDKKTLRVTSLFDIAEHASHTTRKSFIRELFISTARCDASAVHVCYDEASAKFDHGYPRPYATRGGSVAEW